MTIQLGTTVRYEIHTKDQGILEAEATLIGFRRSDDGWTFQMIVAPNLHSGLVNYVDIDNVTSHSLKDMYAASKAYNAGELNAHTCF